MEDSSTVPTQEEVSEKDRDAFTVVMGSKASVLEGEDTRDANVKDITIKVFLRLRSRQTTS